MLVVVSWWGGVLVVEVMSQLRHFAPRGHTLSPLFTQYLPIYSLSLHTTVFLVSFDVPVVQILRHGINVREGGREEGRYRKEGRERGTVDWWVGGGGRQECCCCVVM